MRSRRLAALLALSLAFSACGEEERPPLAPSSTRDAEPALARAAARPGEILIRGEASPASHGPYTLRGRYLVRFEQYAPEDPDLDFDRETSFVAELRGAPAAPVALFERAARRGRRRVHVRLAGRYAVDVSFGDFPYVIRLTPRP